MLIFSTVLLTIISALGIGVFAGYASILGILRMFSRHQSRVEASRAMALHHASGD